MVNIVADCLGAGVIDHFTNKQCENKGLSHDEESALESDL